MFDDGARQWVMRDAEIRSLASVRGGVRMCNHVGRCVRLRSHGAHWLHMLATGRCCVVVCVDVRRCTTMPGGISVYTLVYAQVHWT